MKRRLVWILIPLAAIALAILGLVLARRAPRDPAAVLTAAIARARGRLPEFRARLAHPQPQDRGFFLRATLRSGKEAETLWLKEVSATASGYRGVIAEAPFQLPWKVGQAVEVEPSQVVDWTIVERDGTKVGAFTQGLEGPVEGS